ncbi:PDZK1-interacting protein 1 [Alligator mississippiensis]|uniref:PDZK1-interacting protein 1 n=1 Tax=Alligator mississippiensis TaxID=8496 RepID=A0A151M464_ALLMI|nr:PDZK1-interacting protein 1 [Alligator mississippiensis]KYO19313.1 PDZK1-interacting protein 1 [Alligator mississippiensis]
MHALQVAVLCLLIALEPVNCQETARRLQPWMQGLIAVAVFLVLVAIAFVVNRYWCQEKDESMESVVTIGNKPESIVSNGHEGKYSSNVADFRSRENERAYENVIEYDEKVLTTAM